MKIKYSNTIKNTAKILLIMLFVLLVGCKKPAKPSGDEIKKVEFSNGNGTYSNFIDKFTLEEVELLVTYKNDNTLLIPLNINMISQDDFNKLLLSGVHIIEVNYLDYKLNAFIEITGTSSGQNKPSAVSVYSLTEKVDESYVTTYYSTGISNYISYQIQYKYDEINVTDIEVLKNDELNGSFVSSVEDGFVTVTYSQQESILGNTQLFSIKYNANEKYHNFKINYLYDNGFYYYNDNSVYVINGVSYYDR